MNRYLDIDFKTLKRGQHIFQRPQSCNKTGSLKSLEGESVLFVTAKNSLLSQVADRFPKTIQTLHYELNLDNEKTWHKKSRVREMKHTGYGWNYSSLHKLSDFKEHEKQFKYMVIDEPILLWEHSNSYKPNWANESEFLSRVIHTPVVIYLGADFPEYILEEIEEIGELRGDRAINPDEPDFIIEDNNFNPFEDMYDEDLARIRQDIGKW